MRILIILLILFFYGSSLFAQNCADPDNIYTFFYDGKKYEIVKENNNWNEAAICAYERGGILTHIDSQEEQDTIFYHLNNAEIDPLNTVASDGGDKSYVWIGGNDIAEEGKWIWDGSDDGIGPQFWQGNLNGNPVDSLYSNWGREPDNSGGQDALGLAITNWPRGVAGEWNDVSKFNKLYFVIEYDNSTIRLNKVDYIHKDGLLIINSTFYSAFDSLQLLIDDLPHKVVYNVLQEDSLITSSFNVSITSYIQVRLQGYIDGFSVVSRSQKILVYVFNDPIESYSTDFENSPVQDFIGENFEIKREFGFRNNAIHSEHNYQESTNLSYSLIKPIIINNTEPLLTYSDVAIIEPGEDESIFGEDGFKDYVVVEGSKDADEWLPLAPGYDARYHSDWESSWYSPALVSGLFKNHSINLTDTFSAGDTILIRFRLFSDDQNTGWGWVIDSLQIQEFPISIGNQETIPNSFRLENNYPNPFNPTTVISYQLAEAGQVELSVYDIAGQLVQTLVNTRQNQGVHSVTFDAANLSSGTYIYRLNANGNIFTKKMLLLK